MLTSGGSNAIKQGKDVNAYGFSCTIRTLTLWINGTEVTQIQGKQVSIARRQCGLSEFRPYESLPVIVNWMK